MLNVGIIGAGAVARDHAAAIAASSEARLAAVASRSAASARRLAAEHGAVPVDDPEALLRCVDAVIVTSPGHTHAAYATAALRAQVSVLCEKPGAISAEEARAVARAAAVSRGVYRVGFNRRHAPVYAELASLVRARRIVPSSFNVRIDRGELQRPGWVADPAASGGYLLETVVHLVDMVRHLFGEIRAWSGAASRRHYQELDNFSLLLQTDRGVHGVLTSCAHASWQAPFERLEVYGDHVVAATHEMDRLTFNTGLDAPAVARDFAPTPKGRRLGFDTQWARFARAVAGRPDADDPSATAADLVQNVRFVEDVYAAVRAGDGAGRWVERAPRSRREAADGGPRAETAA